MSVNDRFSEDLERYGPTLPVPELVIELNKIYHRFEARDFDERHSPDFAQMDATWRRMLGEVVRMRKGESFRILNFGCGTGFEAGRVLAILPKKSIAKFTCYDLSPDMLARCREKHAASEVAIHFTNELVELLSAGHSYNLLITNQMLHHLIDVKDTITRIMPILAPNALWAAGHEPSSRYMRNPECARVYNDFIREHAWKKYLRPMNYVRFLKGVFGIHLNCEALTAKEAYANGIFRSMPSESVIHRLVDFQSTRDYPESSFEGGGLDFESLQKDFEGVWEPAFIETYNFMGPHDETLLSAKWTNACKDLRRAYPHDGSDFSVVWKRTGS